MEAINVLARFVLTVVLVVFLSQFILFFCTVVVTCFPDVVVLNRAIQCRPGFSCLWKLIGDCCTVIHPVSDSSIR